LCWLTAVGAAVGPSVGEKVGLAVGGCKETDTRHSTRWDRPVRLLSSPLSEPRWGTLWARTWGSPLGTAQTMDKKSSGARHRCTERKPLVLSKNTSVGAGVGKGEGGRVGASVGASVGCAVGDGVGESVGKPVGALVGSPVGEAVGSGVGTAVGVCCTGPPPTRA
jgi:hypothetical protein